MKKSLEIKKICKIHNSEKQQTQVKINGKIVDKLTCKECKLAYDIEYRAKTKEKRRKRQKKYYQENKIEIIKNAKLYHQENKCQILSKKIEYNKINKIEKNERDRKYYQENKEERIEYAKQYAIKNEAEIKEYQSIYYKLNSTKLKNSNKKRYKNNKQKINKKQAERSKNRRKNDPAFRLKGNVSHLIREALKYNGKTKNGKSILNFLPYTMKKLKEHLESQFELWMNWNNYGQYRVDTWNDNDQATWTWQIDHIIPHSKFQYSSMSDEEFQKCWTLSNLRPYSAKQNLIDGNRRN